MKRLILHCLPLLPLMFTGCGQSAADLTAKSEAKALQEQIAILKEDMARTSIEVKAAERDLGNARKETKRLHDEAKAEREALKKQLDEATKAFTEYKEKYRAASLKKAPGLRLERLVCGADQVFKDIEVISVSPGELNFRHASGLAKVPLGRLDSDLRERFSYRPEEAAAWLKAEDAKKLAAAEAPLAGPTAKGSGGIKKPASDYARVRLRYQQDLNYIYKSAKALQLDNTGCPTHKQYQLSAWATEAASIKRIMAKLPGA